MARRPALDENPESEDDIEDDSLSEPEEHKSLASRLFGRGAKSNNNSSIIDEEDSWDTALPAEDSAHPDALHEDPPGVDETAYEDESEARPSRVLPLLLVLVPFCALIGGAVWWLQSNDTPAAVSAEQSASDAVVPPLPDLPPPPSPAAPLSPDFDLRGDADPLKS